MADDAPGSKAGAFTQLLPHEETLGGLLGIEHVEVGAERAVARFEIENRHRQPLGIVHGGVYAAVAEGLTSEATFHAVYPEGMAALGMSNDTSFMRPILAGTVTAVATRKHGGRTTWVWEVEFTDEDDRLCVLSRVTVAVRPLPPGTPTADGGVAP